MWKCWRTDNDMALILLFFPTKPKGTTIYLYVALLSLRLGVFIICFRCLGSSESCKTPKGKKLCLWVKEKKKFGDLLPEKPKYFRLHSSLISWVDVCRKDLNRTISITLGSWHCYMACLILPNSPPPPSLHRDRHVHVNIHMVLKDKQGMGHMCAHKIHMNTFSFMGSFLADQVYLSHLNQRHKLCNYRSWILTTTWSLPVYLYWDGQASDVWYNVYRWNVSVLKQKPLELC